MQFKKLFLVLVVGAWGVDSCAVQLFVKTLTGKTITIEVPEELKLIGNISAEALDSIFEKVLEECGDDHNPHIIFAGHSILLRDTSGLWLRDLNVNYCLENESTYHLVYDLDCLSNQVVEPNNNVNVEFVNLCLNLWAQHYVEWNNDEERYFPSQNMNNEESCLRSSKVTQLEKKIMFLFNVSTILVNILSQLDSEQNQIVLSTMFDKVENLLNKLKEIREITDFSSRYEQGKKIEIPGELRYLYILAPEGYDYVFEHNRVVDVNHRLAFLSVDGCEQQFLDGENRTNYKGMQSNSTNIVRFILSMYNLGAKMSVSEYLSQIQKLGNQSSLLYSDDPNLMDVESSLSNQNNNYYSNHKFL